jgi:amino acid adenylation domain-containing protein
MTLQGESIDDDPAWGFASVLAFPPEDRPRAIVQWLRGEVARHVGVAPERIDEREPLIRLGLDSLAAAELQDSLERQCGMRLPLTLLLQDTDLAALGRELLAGASGAADRHRPVPRAAVAGLDSALSHGQRALWVLHCLAPESGAYHIAVAARVTPPLDVAALRQALCALAERHPLLRATFHQIAGEPRQRVGGGLAPEVCAIEACDCTEEELAERMHRDAARPFNLAAGPLLRAQVWRRSPTEDRLLLAVHHLVADFWTLALLARELSTLYACTGPETAMLPAASASYLDHVHWEAARLAGPEGDRLWEYWRRQLQGPLPVLNLATDRPRPPLQTYAGGSVSARVGLPLCSRIAELARAGGATLSSALLTAFVALLQRYTGVEDVTVGVPAAGRATLAATAGYYVNPVVLRADLSGEPSFASLLARVQQAAVAAFEHQEYPFAVLVEKLQPVRDPSRSPLFQAMFTLLSTRRPEQRALIALALREGGGRMGFGGHLLESVPWQERTSQCELALRAGVVNDSLVLSLQYNSDLFDAVTICRMLDHLQALLAAAVADPSLAIVDLPLLVAEERHQILRVWSGALHDGGQAGSCCLHELFESAAVQTPAALAVIEGERRWTYSRLNRRANQLAHHLRRLGVRPEQRVGVLLGRSSEMVAALLGILKAGAAYVPLDPSYPDGWLAFAAEDARLSLLLTSAQLCGKLPDRPMVDVASDAVALEPEHDPEPLAVPGNLAYVMYTSGSTGRPKGVAIEHCAPVARMHWARLAFAEETLAGVLASTSICFDLSVFEIFYPLSWGGTVILAEDALALPTLPAAAEVRLLNTVPSVMAELVAAELPPRLHTICLAGETFPKPLADRIHSRAGVEQVWNLYGPTEDATYSTWARIERGAASVSIGRPLPGTRAYVLDSRLEAVPGGVPGTLLLAGAGAARGYFGRPDLTAERFIPDPMGAAPGGRLYLTGDQARWLGTGDLELLGRLDHQVKVRGFRIELGEVERVLCEHPQVREAAVVVRDSPAGGLSLAAYAAPAEVGVAELRRYLRERLPSYMRPASIRLFPALPRTVNGKLDRRALPDGADAEAACGALRTPTEELVAEIWVDLLGVPRVGASDNFFHLGGHSLLAMRAATRLQDLFGVPVSLQQILQSPTVSELAEQLDGRKLAGRGLTLPLLGRAPRPPLLPLSFAQERLWFLAQLEPGSPAYHMAAAIHLAGALRVDLLAAAFAALVRRHEALRTSFVATDGRQVQQIAAFAGQPLPVVDLAALPALRLQDEIQRVVSGEARRPFDLGRGPLLRVCVLRLARSEHILAVTLHHIVADGWSLQVLAREVSAVYAAFARRAQPELPQLPVQYADFAVWQRSWLAGGEMERQLGYWRQALHGAPAALDLPTDRPRPAVPTWRGAQKSVRLAPQLGTALAASGRRAGATLFMAFVAGTAALLWRWTRQPDLVLGAPIANRSWTEIENLIGLFANTFPLRVQITAAAGFHALLRDVRQTALAAYSCQDLPFEKLVDDLHVARLPGRSPLFQVLVGLWSAPLAELDLTGVSARRLDCDLQAAKLDLSLRFELDERGIGVQAEYGSDLFEAVTIERLLAHLHCLLAGATADPERSLADLPLTSPAELHQLLCEWNDTARREAPTCIYELFERQAAHAPEALAVEAAGDQLTWRELRRRSRRLAWSLRRQGIGLESRVGVLLPRSADQIVAILGVLAAGGAYVPLDPASPVERLHLILDEADIAVVVTVDSLRGLLPAGCAAVLPPTAESLELSPLQALPPQPAPGPANLAYVLYTSGSTGRPKGVMVEHRSVINLLAALRETVHRGAVPPLRFALNAPLTFDASVKQWIQLLDGHSLHLLPEEVRSDAERMLRLLRDWQVQVLDCTPGQLAYLAAGLLREPGSVERVLVGGEELPRAEWSLLAGSERPCFYNVYGPTECTVDTTVAAVRADRPVLGRPLANVSVYLLDPALNPVPMGTIGELCVGGVGVARGYVRLPAQTAERFVPDPWARGPGARIYRTGDLARRLPDGTVEFLGRLDHQVKVQGFRIELGEIEAVLGQHPDVLAAAVLVCVDGPGQRRLVAYVACPGEPQPSASDLRSYLKRKLPAYMMPSAFHVLTELPRTSNGKIARSALIALDGQFEQHRTTVEPSTPLEKVLAGLVARVLGLDRVGLYDNFFERGGHSMRAVELVASLRDAFGIDLPLFHVFDSPTVAGLSAVLLESPEWRQSMEELAPALLQITEPLVEPASRVAERGEG